METVRKAGWCDRGRNTFRVGQPLYACLFHFLALRRSSPTVTLAVRHRQKEGDLFPGQRAVMGAARHLSKMRRDGGPPLGVIDGIDISGETVASARG